MAVRTVVSTGRARKAMQELAALASSPSKPDDLEVLVGQVREQWMHDARSNMEMLEASDAAAALCPPSAFDYLDRAEILKRDRRVQEAQEARRQALRLAREDERIAAAIALRVLESEPSQEAFRILRDLPIGRLEQLSLSRAAQVLSVNLTDPDCPDGSRRLDARLDACSTEQARDDLLFDLLGCILDRHTPEVHAAVLSDLGRRLSARCAADQDLADAIDALRPHGFAVPDENGDRHRAAIFDAMLDRVWDRIEDARERPTDTHACCECGNTVTVSGPEPPAEGRPADPGMPSDHEMQSDARILADPGIPALEVESPPPADLRQAIRTALIAVAARRLGLEQ